MSSYPGSYQSQQPQSSQSQSVFGSSQSQQPMYGGAYGPSAQGSSFLTGGSFGQQGSMQSLSKCWQELPEPFNKLRCIICKLYMAIREWLGQGTNGPSPIAAIVLTLLVIIIAPIALFLLYAGATIATTFSLATVAFLMVEGFLLVIGGGVLAIVLGVTTVFTGIGFTWLFGFYAAYKVTQVMYQKLYGQYGSSSSSYSGYSTSSGYGQPSSFADSLKQMGQSASDYLKDFTTGGSSMGRQQPQNYPPSQFGGAQAGSLGITPLMGNPGAGQQQQPQPQQQPPQQQQPISAGMR